MTTQNNEIVITESAMRKVLSNDENLRLKCLVESLHEKVLELEKELAEKKEKAMKMTFEEEPKKKAGRPKKEEVEAKVEETTEETTKEKE